MFSMSPTITSDQRSLASEKTTSSAAVKLSFPEADGDVEAAVVGCGQHRGRHRWVGAVEIPVAEEGNSLGRFGRSGTGRDDESQQDGE